MRSETCINQPLGNAPEEAQGGTLPRGSKTIRIPCDQNLYQEIIQDPKKFRSHLDMALNEHPELFPKAMSNGYQMYGITPPSVKMSLQIRRIMISATGETYSVHPSFLMPYMTGFASDVEHALFLHQLGVPYWALTHVFGRNDMYWYRLVTSFGRASIVGTTVKDPEKLPSDLIADEKHTSLKGEKIYAAMTVGENCILGATVCENAGEKALTEGYGKFAGEAKNVDPNYQAKTVNTDGWKATQNAFKTLFKAITVITCFLHAWINIRDRCKRSADLLEKLGNAVWNVYEAKNKRSFAQRIRRLQEKALQTLDKGIVLDKVLSLCAKSSLFSKFYDHPTAHRTSNMVDRLMRWQDKHLFNMQYFHGNLVSAEIGLRAWSILRNFQPYCSRKVGNRTELMCAAEQLNGFVYSDNWLENLLISSSMGGYRQ